MSYHARDYQVAFHDAILREWGHAPWWDGERAVSQSTIGNMATSAGKTICAAMLAKTITQQLGGRLLFCADRLELIDQPVEKFHKSCGIIASVERAEDRASMHNPVVITSVQTMSRQNRMDRYPSDHFTHIIDDEAHRNIEARAKIHAHFPNAKVLGITATPFRAGLADLSKWYKSVAFELGTFDLVSQGYISPIKVLTVPLEVDLTQVRQKSGDYDQEQVQSVMRPFYPAIARIIKEHAKDWTILAFLPLISSSKEFVEVMKEDGLTAMHVDGGSPDRREIKEGFERGEFQILSNSQVFCLDDQTEILTSRGFAGINDFCRWDEVANWHPDGHVSFSQPANVALRNRKPGEEMVSVSTCRNNFRVTEDHDMVVECGTDGNQWKKVKAKNLRAGHALPSCGIAAPFSMVAEQPERVSQAAIAKKITSAAYAIRSRHPGTSRAESRRIAEQRTLARCSLRYKDPFELSIEECWLIGFWVADGSLHVTPEGCRRYSLAQSMAYPSIVSKVDEILAKARVTHSRHAIKPVGADPYISWALSLGNWGDEISSDGVFRLIPYLKKEGTKLLWGLSESQFDSLLHGYWAGDGSHGQPVDFEPDYVFAADTKYAWLDLLCAIGSVRGWRCSLQPIAPRQKPNPIHMPQWSLSMSKGRTRRLSHKTAIKKESEHKEEKVWCVTVESGNIITRRGGMVTVTGNSTGVDFIRCNCLLNLAPTRSRVEYRQRAGRIMRLIPGTIDPGGITLPTAEERRAAIAASSKPFCAILDLLWQTSKIGLAGPASLLAMSEEDEGEIAERVKKQRTPEELSEISQRVRIDRETKLRKALEAAARERAQHDARRASLIDARQLVLDLQERELSDYEPVMPWEKQKPRQFAVDALSKWGIDSEDLSAGMASKLIDSLNGRQKRGLAPVEAFAGLRAAGIDDVEHCTLDRSIIVLRDSFPMTLGKKFYNVPLKDIPRWYWKWIMEGEEVASVMTRKRCEENHPGIWRYVNHVILGKPRVQTEPMTSDL